MIAQHSKWKEMQEAESQRMLKAIRSVSAGALKQQIGWQTRELTELFRVMLAVSWVKWAWAGDKRKKRGKYGGCTQSNIRTCVKALAIKANVETGECPFLPSKRWGQAFQLACHPAKENGKNTFFSSIFTYMCHFQSSIHNTLLTSLFLKGFLSWWWGIVLYFPCAYGWAARHKISSFGSLLL